MEGRAVKKFENAAVVALHREQDAVAAQIEAEQDVSLSGWTDASLPEYARLSDAEFARRQREAHDTA